MTIGRVAARTGLPVRTIRFWSDIGAVPPVERSGGGYRLYDAEAVARLELVATLRDLGLGLEEIRRVLAKEVTISDLAAAHMEALDARIRTLRLRRAVLSTFAKRGTSTEEMTLMNRLARLSAQERKKIIDDFLTEVLGDAQAATGMLAHLRDAAPTLPDDPTPEQVDAWVELAELILEPGFRRGVRALADYTTQQRRTPFTRRIIKQVDTGVEPRSAQAAEVLDRVLDDTVDRAALLRELETVTDPRAERYWELLATINGWPPYPEGVPRLEHLAAGLRAHRWTAEALRAHS
ncbi:MerR family transcriptional regulator [Sphaerisporangium flaviroseum]|uniref:MerR family transcriptional regulator n=1 Tax=Sphaerisporangium flaviroseum TaxID=509199 RepID=A0ABP7IJS1_9ACTN